MHKTLGSVALVVTGLAVATSCGKTDKSKDKEDVDDSTQSGQVNLDTNPLGESYPEGLAVQAFNTTDDTEVTNAGTVAISYDSASLNLTPVRPALALLQEPQPAPAGQMCFNSYEDALAQHTAGEINRLAPPPPPRAGTVLAKERVNGKAGSCFPDELEANIAIIKDEVKKGGTNLDGYGECFMPDWGIVNGFYPKSDDVCAVGYVRNELVKLRAFVEFTKGLSEAMLCQALKDGVVKEELGKGGAIDLTQSLGKALARPTGNVANVKSAKISRVGTAERSFLTEIVVTPIFPGDPSSPEMTLSIEHAPTDATNAAYTGVIHVSHPTKAQKVGDGVRAISLNYTKSADATGSRLKYEMRAGVFALGKSPFGSDGQLDYNVYGQKEGDAKVERMNYVTYDGYPDLDVAKLSYWVNFGGSWGEPARGMVFDTKRVSGKVKGCAVAGSTSIVADGYSIRRSIAEGYSMLPVGYLKALLCDEAQKTGPKMWLQCFERNDAGAFRPNPELVTDVNAGYDFVESSVVESKAPELADVPRPPKYDPAKPPIAPTGAPKPKQPPPPPPG